MALPRVYDIAKELGIDTKVALAKLEELGEYVKGGSSTIAPPVAAKLRAAFPNAEKPAPKKPAAKSTKAKAKAEVSEDQPAAQEKPADEAKVEPKQDKAPAAPATQSPLTGIPRPGNNPFASA
ncbi:MAG: translation initiation factor IF-2, partial [Actinobacteria bacterium]|nr:translation initiation factor IF-2 [Actinomycetota bacterium]